MKWFFAGLLVTNLALLGGAWMSSDRGQELVAASVTPAGPGLILLGELEKSLPLRSEAGEEVAAAAHVTEPVQAVETPATVTAVPAEPEATAESTPDAQFSCLRLAGLESKSIAATAAQVLAQGGGLVKRQGEEAGETKRYWVMLPPVASPTAATPILQRLERAGVKDFYLIRSGENANAISLGVYSAKDSAQRRVQQIRALKLKPRIEEIALPVKRWWLEFDWPVDGNPEAWRALLPRELRATAVKVCR